MLTVTFHFHGDLNDFLPREQRQRDLVTTLPETAAVILHRLQPKTQRYYDTFQRCTVCDRIYWQGSHYARLEGTVEEVRRVTSDNCETGN